MNFNHLFIGLLTSILFLQGCVFTKKEESQIDYVAIKINDIYSMDIPSFMKKTDNLNDDALLQFQNIYKETYVIVIDENKQEFIDVFTDYGEYDSTKTPVENYRKIQLGMLSEGIEMSYQSEPSASKIKGLPAQQVQADGQVEGIRYEISYFLTFVEGEQNLYMIMAWTIKDRKEKYAEMFKTIAGTFKEL
jgi:hypothetical protein